MTDASFNQRMREQSARAWQQGYDACQLEWIHLYDGHTVDHDDLTGMCIECCQGNPYEEK